MKKAVCALVLLAGCGVPTSFWSARESETTYHNEKALWEVESLVGPRDGTADRSDDLEFLLSSVEEPGEAGSALPALTQFRAPQGEEAAIFATLHFDTDDAVIHKAQELDQIQKIANYLKRHPECNVCIAGHCDERGPEGYNLSLGSRRASFIRDNLLKNGVAVNQVHILSYGKERPVAMGHTAADWKKNRRAEFSIHNVR